MLNDAIKIIRYGSIKRKIEYISRIQESPISESLSKEYIEALSVYKTEILNDENLTYFEKQEIIESETKLWNECSEIFIFSEIEKEIIESDSNVSEADHYMQTYYSSLFSIFPTLIENNYLEQIDKGYNWKKSAALFAGLLRSNYGGAWNKDLPKYLLVNSKVSNSLDSEYRKKTIPRKWDELERIIPSLTLT